MLEPILADTRDRIAALPPVAELRAMAADAPPVRRFGPALHGDRLGVIAEVKRRSPSRGDLAPGLDPVERARSYVAGGAAAVSVLTEPSHFGGSSDDLRAVRNEVGVPVLRKDFTLVVEQVWEARGMGADAILLIVAALDDADLARLAEAAGEAGMDALVEVHDEFEAERALAVGASMVGVNNRDLTTFDVDLGTAEKLAPLLDGVETVVAESGILEPSDATRMAASGYHAVLVGERLVRADDPAELISLLRVRR